MVGHCVTYGALIFISIMYHRYNILINILILFLIFASRYVVNYHYYKYFNNDLSF